MKINSIVKIIIIILFVIVLSTFVYSYLLDLNLLDSLYMTIITISTVGFTEVAPMTNLAKIYSIFLILTSITIGAFSLSKIVDYVSQGHLKRVWGMKRMEKRIKELKGHYILCGVGEIGLHIIEEFVNANEKIVVIDSDETVIEQLKKMDVSYIYGNATDEETLLQAKIKNAEGLISVLNKDSDNVFVVLTARQLCPKINILSRVIEKSAENKLVHAGANLTISPYEIGGKKIFNMLLNPKFAYFIDDVIKTDDLKLEIEEIEIAKNSRISNISLKDSNISANTGLLVIAIKKIETGKFLFNPGAKVVLNDNDKVIVIGQKEKINLLKEMAK